MGKPSINGQFSPITSGWWYTYPSEKYESQLGLPVVPRKVVAEVSKIGNL